MPGASQALRALKSIRNARDMADSIPGVKPGALLVSCVSWPCNSVLTGLS